MFSLFRLFAQFEPFRVPNGGPESTLAIELRDSAGVYLLDSDGKQLTVTA